MNLKKLFINLCLLTFTFGCDVGGGQLTATKPAGGQIKVGSDPGTQAFLARSGFLGSASINDRAIGANRYLAYHSSQDLLPADSNGQPDIYLRDTLTGVSQVVSVSSANAQGDGASTQASISADGRYVVFRSAATNLVAGDTNGVEDIFMRDTLAGTTVRVSLGNGTTQATGTSLTPAVSNGGRYVVFASEAGNLATGDSNAQPDIFLRDTKTNTTTLISSTSIGIGSANGASFDPAITPDGAFIAFSSEATNVIAGGLSGRQVLRVERAAPTNRVLVSQNGSQANGPCYEPTMSNDGNIIAFFSNATNLGTDSNVFFDVYVRDIGGSTTTRISAATAGETDNHSGFPSISGDGSIVAFGSIATNLVAGDSNGVFDVFTSTGTTTQRVSVNSAGGQANIDSDLPAISLDGKKIAFRSAATDLVPQDNVADDDIYIHHLASASTVLQSLACKFPPIDPAKGVDKNYVPGVGRNRISLEDLDGDGSLDMVGITSFMLNDGLGNYGAPVNLQLPLTPPFYNVDATAAGDIDGDGDIDICVLTTGVGFQIFLNPGTGVFGSSSTVFPGASMSSSSSEAFLKDLDSDGDLDFIVINDGVDGFTIIPNTRTTPGQLSFGTPVSYTLFPSSSSFIQAVSIDFADINGDNIIDLCALTASRGAVVYFGTGDTNFTRQTAYPIDQFMTRLQLGDINGDGHNDIVAVNRSGSTGGLYRLINDGTGVFGSSLPVINEGNGFALELADIEQDGDLDVIMSDLQTNSVIAFRNDGSGEFPNYTRHDISSDARQLAIGDLDGDSDLDMCVVSSFSSDGTTVLLEQLNPYFPKFTESTNTIPANAFFLSPGDFNGDSLLDLVYVHGSPFTLEIRLGQEAGVFSAPAGSRTIEFPYRIIPGDIDGDGDTDLVLPHRLENKASVYKTDGTGAISAPVVYDFSHPVQYGQLADVDGDSDLDLILSQDTINMVILFNDGSGAFTTRTNYTPGGAFIAEDLDSDGDIDLITSRNQVMLNNGSGVFTTSPSQPSEPGKNAVSMALTDLDGDGIKDLIGGISTRTGTIWKGLGGGLFQAGTGFKMGHGVASLLGNFYIELNAVDIDSDGDTDLVAGLTGPNSSLSILLNDGQGNLAQGLDQLSDRAGNWPVIADFDSDGDLDVVIGAAFDTAPFGRVVLLLNQVCP